MAERQCSRITRLREGRYVARSIRSDEITDEQWDEDARQAIVLLHVLNEDGRSLIIFHGCP